MGKMTMGVSNTARRVIPETQTPTPLGTVEIQYIPVISEVIREVPIETIREVIRTVEVVRTIVQTVEVPVDVIKEVVVFVDRQVDVVREVKIIDIEKLMLANAEIRNLTSSNKTLKVLLMIAVITAIAMGMR